MGVGAMLRASTRYDVTHTDGAGVKTSSTYTIAGGLLPSWSGQGAYGGGMGVPGAWRAALLRADLLGGVPWHAYLDDDSDGRAARITPNPLVLEQPAPPEPRISTISSMALDYIWHGNAIGVKLGVDRYGDALAVAPADAQFTWVRRVQPGDGIPLPVGDVGYFITLPDQAAGHWYSADEVLHVKGPCRPGELRGWGVLENHLATLDMSREQTKQAAAGTGAGVPTGVLKSHNPDLDAVEAGTIKSGWMAAQAARTVAVLNETTDFLPLSWNPTQAQLVEARQFTDRQIAQIFGLDASWLGAGDSSMTYSNIEMEAVHLLKFGSPAGDLARFEAALSTMLGPRRHAKANLDALLRGDTLSRFQAHVLGFGRWLTADEIRAREDMPALTATQRAELVPPAPEPAPGGAPAQTRAAHAGNAAELQRYWTKDPEGLAKWADEPRPFTALVAHLAKYVTDPEGLAATYYKRVFKRWPSDDPS